VKQKNRNILKGGLFAILMMMAVIAAANPARVVSKRENIPFNGNMMTNIFVDTTPDDGDNRADALIQLYGTNLSMSLQEFSDLIQIGDIIEYNPRSYYTKEGRFSIITNGTIVHLNGRNIYEIFVDELQDPIAGHDFYEAQRAYEAKKRQAAQR